MYTTGINNDILAESLMDLGDSIFDDQGFELMTDPTIIDRARLRRRALKKTRTRAY
jgi:hypothetical protein